MSSLHMVQASKAYSVSCLMLEFSRHFLHITDEQSPSPVQNKLPFSSTDYVLHNMQ